MALSLQSENILPVMFEDSSLVILLDDSFDVDNAWESIRENIKASAKDNLGYQKLKHNKPWFDDECSKLIEQQNRLNYNGCKIQANSVELICKI
jgi:hypothetical protein